MAVHNVEIKQNVIVREEIKYIYFKNAFTKINKLDHKTNFQINIKMFLTLHELTSRCSNIIRNYKFKVGSIKSGYMGNRLPKI